MGYRDAPQPAATEAEIRHSEESFRHLFRSNPQPMWLYDPETLLVLVVNDAAIARYGFSREAFLGMQITDLAPAGVRPGLAAYLGSAHPNDQQPSEWSHQFQDGTVVDVEITAWALDFAGRPAHLGDGLRYHLPGSGPRMG